MARYIYISEGQAVVPGDQVFTASGTFTVPAYNTLTVRVWGAGGGGAGVGFGGSEGGGAGGNSDFNGDVFGNGGGGTGDGGNYAGGAGGTNSGGDSGENGQAGSNGNLHGTPGNGKGGDAGGSGGAGGAARPLFEAGNGNPGAVPGGGGGGSRFSSSAVYAGGGGGGYATRTYSVGQLTLGAPVDVVVGTGGAGGIGIYYTGGNGANGRVEIEWE